ncbi:GNAT family N-acetyltransferase [Roseibium sp. M-1]
MTTSGANFVIRSANLQDLAGLRELYRHLISDDRPAPEELQQKTFAGMLDHPGLTLLVGKKGDQLISTCTLVIVPNLTRGCASYALIENVVTHSAWRGKGVGRDLLQAAIDKAFAEGCFKVMLMSGNANIEAHRFYETLGFLKSKTGFELRAPGYPPRR